MIPLMISFLSFNEAAALRPQKGDGKRLLLLRREVGASMRLRH